MCADHHSARFQIRQIRHASRWANSKRLHENRCKNPFNMLLASHFSSSIDGSLNAMQEFRSSNGGDNSWLVGNCRRKPVKSNLPLSSAIRTNYPESIPCWPNRRRLARLARCHRQRRWLHPGPAFQIGPPVSQLCASQRRNGQWTECCDAFAIAHDDCWLAFAFNLRARAEILCRLGHRNGCFVHL